MASGFYASNLIPGNHVTDALVDLQVTVWANPGFTVVGIRANAGLRCVLHATLDFGSSKTEPHCHQVDRLWFYISRL